MATDLTAADTNAAAIAMTEAYTLEQQENEKQRRELQTLRAEMNGLEERLTKARAENRKLREAIASGRCADCHEIAEAVDADLDDDDIDAVMRTTTNAMVRHLNDVLDVEAGLSEVLTRHEGA